MCTLIYLTLQQTTEMKTIGFHKITVTKFRSISFTDKTVIYTRTIFNFQTQYFPW